VLEDTKSSAHKASPAQLFGSIDASTEGLHLEPTIIITNIHDLFKIIVR
jgi:hypothetical protein